MFLPTIFAGLTSLGILFLLFKNKLKENLDCSSEEIVIKDKFLLIVSLILLGVCIILLAISNYINLEMYLVSLVCALTSPKVLIGSNFSFRYKAFDISLQVNGAFGHKISMALPSLT